MKPIPESTRQLITDSILNNQRLDKRNRDQWRPLDIAFEEHFGSVIVSLGHSRVKATITSEIVEPKASRPSEGSLKIMVGNMASSNCEAGGKNQEETVALVPVLERAIRDTRCIDLEGLCLVSGKKCWDLEASIVVLNADGNLIEVSSIALVAALSHFKRPDVTVDPDGKLTIHPFNEKSPIPLTILYYPFCTKFCFIRNDFSSDLFIVDPREDEEAISDWSLVVTTKLQQEFSASYVHGVDQIDRGYIVRASKTAIERTKTLTKLLRRSLETARTERSQNVHGFSNCVQNRQPVFFGPSHENFFEEIEVTDESESDQSEVQIPIELVQLVLEQLDLEEQFCLRRVNKDFKHVIEKQIWPARKKLTITEPFFDLPSHELEIIISHMPNIEIVNTRSKLELRWTRDSDFEKFGTLLAKYCQGIKKFVRHNDDWDGYSDDNYLRCILMSGMFTMELRYQTEISLIETSN